MPFFFWNESKAPREYNTICLDLQLDFLSLTFPQPGFPSAGGDMEFPSGRKVGEGTSPGEHGSHMVWRTEKRKIISKCNRPGGGRSWREKRKSEKPQVSRLQRVVRCEEQVSIWSNGVRSLRQPSDNFLICNKVHMTRKMFLIFPHCWVPSLPLFVSYTLRRFYWVLAEWWC